MLLLFDDLFLLYYDWLIINCEQLKNKLVVAGYCFIIVQYISLISRLSSSTTGTICFIMPCCLQQNSKCCYCIHCPGSTCHLLKQFDNLIHLVLPVQYASSCHAAFSSIPSVVNVFIVLSQVFLCFKALSLMCIQQFDNLIGIICFELYQP